MFFQLQYYPPPPQKKKSLVEKNRQDGWVSALQQHDKIDKSYLLGVRAHMYIFYSK